MCQRGLTYSAVECQQAKSCSRGSWSCYGVDGSYSSYPSFMLVFVIYSPRPRPATCLWALFFASTTVAPQGVGARYCCSVAISRLARFLLLLRVLSPPPPCGLHSVALSPLVGSYLRSRLHRWRGADRRTQCKPFSGCCYRFSQRYDTSTQHDVLEYNRHE